MRSIDCLPLRVSLVLSLTLLALAAPLAAQGSDSCASATVISGAGQFAFSTIGASGPDVDPGCGSIGADVWFEWTSTSTGSVRMDLCGANYDCVLASWQGSGCPTQVISCNDDSCALQSEINFPVVAGNVYMIQIGGFSGASGSGALTVTSVVVPPNDDCANAQVIAGAGVFPFDSTYATTDGPLELGCTSGSGEVGRDLWFLWSATWAGETTVTTCDLAAFDTQIVVYPWTGCPTGTSIACNDDFCGLRSLLTFDAVMGANYLIRVGSFTTSDGGPGSLEIAEGGLVTGCDDPPVGPDVIVGNITDVLHWGAVGGISAYSIGATACNVGDSTMPWEGMTNHHPVIAQNLYRLKGGSFEQIGMSWIKHGFASATENYCCTCIPPGSGQIMGIGCADTYGASINGSQGGAGVGGLGPRSEVNPLTGIFPYPYGTQGQTGDAIYKRLQVANVDLDPALNPDALYFAEVQYVNPDDAAAGHGNNNASWRPALQGGFSSGGWAIQLSGLSRPTLPAIFAWQEADPLVTLETVDVPGDGRFFVGSRATDNGDGTWHYEIAVHNLTSERAADELSLRLPAGASISNAEFHGVAHHSGEPFDTQDWALTIGATSISWTAADPDPTSSQPEHNALRWGTTFTYRFDADVPPVEAALDLRLFKPGAPQDPQRMLVLAQVPDAGCGVTVRCTANPNSTGLPSQIDYDGSLSFTTNDIALHTRSLPANQFGLFYYGAGELEIPFGNGFQCVGPGGGGLFRLPILNSGPDGFAAYPLDLTNPPHVSGQITAGSTWNFQFWHRDPAAGGAFFNLSDALRITFCP